MTDIVRGRETASRQAHNLEKAGSTPAPATIFLVYFVAGDGTTYMEDEHEDL